MPRSPQVRPARRARAKYAALAVATVLLATAGTVGASTAYGSPAAVQPAATADDGARIVTETRIDARTVDLTVESPAAGKTLPVRVLLPAGFDAQPDRTWPVLYLLQGAHDDYTSWTRETDVEDFLADKDVITVMPSSGPTGIPTAWWNYGSSSSPDYETFQVDEVMQLLRNNYRAGAARAVAGVSTGGYGALAFAARHPGAFGAAASYSGILDTTALGMPTVLNAIVARELQLPSLLWGSPILNRSIWNAHNPAAQAKQLSGTRLYLSQGSGIPSVDFGNLEGAVLEGTLWAQAHGFANRLSGLGIPAEVHFYTGGSHAWSSWQREFKASWPTLAAGLGLAG
ncbi:alpha/beta hydrolase-fold protein [Streptomyces sp. NPDC091267]|uniref:alpha/beta hydrolase n=1 Tax=Streptomyces sp. NPDC091267 TaxID=3155195 RepID=UPI00342E9E4B